jgi:hypothetical protein
MLHDKGGEVRMRGSVDQEPIIMEIENAALRKDEPEVRRREQNSTEKQKSAPPPLRLDVKEKNIYTRREPSPYSYTRTPRTPSSRLSAEFFMSPTPLTPQATAPRNEALLGSFNPRAKRSTSRAENSDESDLDTRQTARLRSRRASPRVSFAESDIPADRRLNRHSDLGDKGDRRTRVTPRLEPTKAESDIPRSAPAEADESYYLSRKLAPASATSSRGRTIPTPLAKIGRSESLYTSRPSEHEFARSTSSLVDQPVFFPTPPTSPKISTRTNSRYPIHLKCALRTCTSRTKYTFVFCTKICMASDTDR